MKDCGYANGSIRSNRGCSYIGFECSYIRFECSYIVGTHFAQKQPMYVYVLVLVMYPTSLMLQHVGMIKPLPTYITI